MNTQLSQNKEILKREERLKMSLKQNGEKVGRIRAWLKNYNIQDDRLEVGGHYCVHLHIKENDL